MSSVSMVDGHIDEPRMSKQEYTPADMVKKLHICLLGFCDDCEYTKDRLYGCKRLLMRRVYNTLHTDNNIIHQQLQKIKQQDEQINGLIAGQETLQKHLVEKNTEIEILIRKKESLRDEICELQSEIERLK